MGVPKLTRQATANYHPSYRTGDGRTSDVKGGDAAYAFVGSATASPPKAPKETLDVKWAIGGCTHPGGSTHKPNQDDYFIYRYPERPGTIVLGVLDGHGRELGELASKTAKRAFLGEFGKANAVESIERQPKVAFVDIFARVHEEIGRAFQKYYVDRGVECAKRGGFFRKRLRGDAQWNCVHGGTTATVVLIVDGYRMYVANVGDSSAVLEGFSTIKPFDYFLESSRKRKMGGDGDPENATIGRGTADDDARSHRELTANHSPENVDEYRRVRAARPHPRIPGKPELRFVYDSLSWSKSACRDVFNIIDSQTDDVAVSNIGEYYKNVRQEWASLVCTPPGAEFQDALAFTRSLGDFHLQSYGVSHVPEVACVDLRDVRRRRSDDAARTVVLLVASDGVWDNWVLKDSIDEVKRVRRDAGFVCDGGSVPVDAEAEAVSKAFMEKNLAVGLRNFGKQADNMTAIACLATFV